MGYDMYRDEHPDNDDQDGYFRLNVYGMSEVRQLLANIGIVRPAALPQPPDAERFGITEYFDSEDEDALTPEQKSYMVALQQWREGPDGEGPGIPSYKLGSNDGWLVTPIEIRSGTLWADDHTPTWRVDFDRDDTGKLALEFVEWMEGSAGGFRVW